MSPHPPRPGAGSTLIDLAIVLLVLVVLGFPLIALWYAAQAARRGVRALARRRPRRWPGRGRQ